ncbi:MAG: hypothetical protein ACI9U2_004944 [Bradymonadia bacterium]|jgi:hypothetical protein
MNTVTPEQPGATRVDSVGAVASGLCAVHCAVCALLPALFGTLGLGMLLGHKAEWIFTLTAIAFGVGALVLGWRRHRSARVVFVLGLGIVGLLASRGLEVGTAHAGHHTEATHAAEVTHAERTAEAAHPAASTEHNEASSTQHDEAAAGVAHAAGTTIGVLAGLLLLLGHLLNIRAARRSRQACCL